MKISTRTEGDFCIAQIDEARIDAASALAFKEGIRSATEDAPSTVVVDLHQVDFIDSSGLGAIVATLKYVTPDRKLVLTGLTPAVQKVFELTRMDRVFTIAPSMEAALGSCRA